MNFQKVQCDRRRFKIGLCRCDRPIRWAWCSNRRKL